MKKSIPYVYCVMILFANSQATCYYNPVVIFIFKPWHWISAKRMGVR